MKESVNICYIEKEKGETKKYLQVESSSEPSLADRTDMSLGGILGGDLDVPRDHLRERPDGLVFRRIRLERSKQGNSV